MRAARRAGGRAGDLDEEHPDLEPDPNKKDDNLCALGSISGRNVVIVCLYRPDRQQPRGCGAWLGPIAVVYPLHLC